MSKYITLLSIIIQCCIANSAQASSITIDFEAGPTTLFGGAFGENAAATYTGDFTFDPDVPSPMESYNIGTGSFTWTDPNSYLSPGSFGYNIDQDGFVDYFTFIITNGNDELYIAYNNNSGFSTFRFRDYHNHSFFDETHTNLCAECVSITLQSPALVPIPAAVWLFGSGLLGLVGVARRKKA